MMSAEYFRAIIDCIGDPVISKDRHYRFVFLNDAACEMFGKPLDYFVGKTDYDCFPQEQADIFRKHDEHVFETGEEDINEEQVTDAQGRVRTIVTKKRLYVDHTGERYVVGVIRDITQRKVTEEALRASTLQLSEAMDLAKIVYWEHDESTGEFIFNDAFYALYGTTAEAEGGYRMARDEYPRRFVHPDDLERLVKEIEDNRARPRADDLEQYEHRAIRRDGEIIHVVDRNRVIMDQEGRVIKAVGVNQDITQRKRAEEELRQKERRESVLNRIANIFLTSPDEDMYGEVLAVVLDALRSDFGMFGFVGENGDLVVPSMTRDVRNQRAVPDRPISLSPGGWGDSLWGRALREQTVFHSSEPFHTPDGHIRIDQRLVAPIVFGNKSIGVLTVANSPWSYTPEDQNLLEGIVNSISPILNARLQRDKQERERKRAEDFLRTSRLQLSDAMDLAKIAYWEVDLESLELVFNDPFYQLLHTKAEQEGGYRMAVDEYGRRFIHPEDLEAFFANHRENLTKLEQQDLFQFEHRALRRDGEIVNILSRTRIIRDGEGRITRIFGSNQDVTEARRAEESLRTSQLRLSEAMDIARLAYWEADGLVGTFTFNDGFYDLIGTTAEKEGGYVVPMEYYFRKYLHPDDLAVTQDFVQEIRSGTVSDRYAQLETRIVRGDGKVRHVLTRLNVLRDPSGSGTKIFGTNQDITESKEMEQALRSSEAKYRGIVESSLVGVFIVQDDVFRFVNKGFCEIHGYPREEVVNRMSPRDLVHPDYRKDLREMTSNLATMGAQLERHHTIVRKDGTLRHVKLLAQTIEYEGRPACSGTIIDITKERSLEAQLHQAQKMEAVGQLAGGVAHDFNNILTAIIGYGSLLKEKLSGTDPARVDVETILAAADRAAHLTSGLLAFSRKQVIQPTPMDLNNAIKKVEQLLARLLTEDIDLRTTYGEGPVRIFGDQGQIEQVLVNLATNARDAMAKGGIFSIVTETVTLSEGTAEGQKGLASGRYALITVSDTGCGMSKETVERIFDPFYTTKDVGKGTGLGLSMVYGIINQHKGGISVTSELGKGTTFRIYLPLTGASVKEEQPTAAATPTGGRETIMVVEDDIVTRTLVVEVLKRFGYTVLEAVDGEDAVGKYAERQGEIDLVILDVIMPKKNGKETYEEMKALRDNLKVLFVSGYTADIMEEKGFFEKGIAFLPKPIAPRVLAAKVREVLDG
jgi:two-component system, cell cycle sensor histidine kinase and response regulator CckA